MTDIAWLNGEIIPADQAAVPVYDLGVVAGASVTEMIRTFNHIPYRLADHLDRLYQSLNIMGFEAQFARSQIEQACQQVLEQNTNSLNVGSDLGIVVFVTAGRNLTYLGSSAIPQAGQGTACIHSFRLPFEFWANKYHAGQKLATSSIAGLHPQSLDPRAKHRNRLHWYLADREVRSTNLGASVLMTDSNSQVTETSAGNFYLLNGRTIRTPPPELVLAGISQTALKELASQLGYNWVAGPITLAEISAADEAWTTSTPYCLLPVTELNGDAIGTGFPGPAFHELIAAWSDAVNLDIVDQAKLVADANRAE
jgi:branched-subunit amino acid aminotransferase/4-amino-4-deoxychorismate lyase